MSALGPSGPLVDKASLKAKTVPNFREFTSRVAQLCNTFTYVHSYRS